MNIENVEHISVLTETLIQQISLPKDAVVVDATIGHGGHSLLLSNILGPEGRIIGFDVDPRCIDKARMALKDVSCGVDIIRSNFSRMSEALIELGVDKVDLILADIGFCSAQLSDPERGFSFQENMPLDMRLDDRLSRTAADILRDSSESEIADIIYKYGEDRASRRIARFIVEQGKLSPIISTSHLSMIVCKALGQRPGQRDGNGRIKIHPATRTFQALRIAVNDELGVLERLLEQAPEKLKVGGKIAIISFHSLEDRIVKNDFKENKQNGVYKVITKKPLVATVDEIRSNPRSRSAKLRIAEKL